MGETEPLSRTARPKRWDSSTTPTKGNVAGTTKKTTKGEKERYDTSGAMCGEFLKKNRMKLGRGKEINLTF